MIAPARTGRASKSKIAVINTDHTNSGIFSNLHIHLRILIIVVIKLIAPKIEEIPARCSEKIAVSTEYPLWKIELDKGGYTVQPVPTPWSINLLIINRYKDGIRSQNLKLLSRGKAISGAPIIKGTSQFPNPPIKIGIVMKKIIIKAWAVTIVL